jgi:hypothetical protein
LTKDQPVHLHGDYEYLTDGYYASQASELEHRPAIPSCADALDAYIVPIALTRVSQAGLPVPNWYLTNEYFTPPALLYGVNPFARAHAVVREERECEEAARSISRSGKFVICCQELDDGATLIEFEQVLDGCPDARYTGWAQNLFAIFRMPLALVRLIEQEDKLYFSAIERLPRKSLSEAAHALLTSRGFVDG